MDLYLAKADCSIKRFVVSESSGCLDLSDGTSEFSLSRTHFEMNKFGKPGEEDFQILCEVIKNIIGALRSANVLKPCRWPLPKMYPYTLRANTFQ
jgi:hypothetical protein